MSKSRSQFSVIDNSGPNTLLSFLRSETKSCNRIDLAVAFITEKGLGSLLYALKRTAKRGQVRLLTGLYQGFSDPKALRSLLHAQQDCPDRLFVHLSTDHRFHWKSYFLFRRTSCTVISGSSNLTEDGLHTPGEFNMVVTLPQASKPLRKMHDVFEKNWIAKSRPLTQDILARYDSWREDADLSTSRRSVPISRILGRAKQTKEKAEPPPPPQFCRTWVDSDLSAEAMEVIWETTEWDRRGYDYFATWRETYRIGDRVILFDLVANAILVVEIRDTAKSPVQTPDGRNFAAYTPVRRMPQRRITKRRWDRIKSDGLMKRKSDMTTTKRLSQAQYDRFVENLKQS